MNKLRKNKKGINFLGEETAKILIVAVCIMFLVYFFGALVFSAIGSEQLKQADSILNSEEGIVSLIKSGKDNLDFKIPAPTGWYLFGFKEKKPNNCLQESCLCLCEKVGGISLALNKDAQLERCDKKGKCVVVSNLKESFEIEIEKGKLTSILIQQLNGEIEIREN